MGWPIHRPVGLTHHDPSRTFKGYTLLCGTGAQDAVLLDMDGLVVHRWRFADRRLFNVELLPTGNLLALTAPLNPPPPREDAESSRFALDPGGPPEIFDFLGGRGSGLRELDWDGNTVWEYHNLAIHHDFHRLDNGHTLAVEWVPMNKEIEEEVPGGGQQPNQPMPPQMLGDDFIELDAGGTVVNRTSLWQLLPPEDAPICPLENRWEWTHTNSLRQLPDGGLLFSSRNTSKIGIVDPAQHGQPAALRWLFGYPEISHQHHTTWQPSASGEGGEVLLFDNGMHRMQDLTYSRIISVNPQTNQLTTIYQGEPREQFFSAHISSVERLPNGNHLVTEGGAGRLFELDRKGTTIWEWISPFQVKQRGDNCNWVFRAHRYAPTYEGLAGRELDAGQHEQFNQLHSLRR